MKFLMNQNIIKHKEIRILMILKNFNLIIFQFQSKLFMKYSKDIFTNNIFYIAP